MKLGHKQLVPGLLQAVCIWAVVGMCLATIGHADVSSPWLATGLPVLQKDADLSAGSLPPFSYNGNLDCSQRNFITRPARTIPVLQTQISHSSCGIQTGFGAMDPDGYLLFNNSGVAGKTLKYQDIDSKVIAIPGSTTLIHYVSAPDPGLYLFFTQNAPSALTPSVNPVTGEVTYAFNRPDDVALRDKSGKLLPVQTDSLSFSANGQWMVVDSPYASSMLRVNLQTFEVLPFAPSFNYNIGVAPGVQSAITSDGRYAVVASQGFSGFKLYDLSTCTNIPSGAITAPASCQSRDLWSYMRDQVTGYRGVSTLRFISNNVLSLYASYHPTPSGINLVSKYLLAAPGQTIQHSQYLALGDSFASGEGARAYTDGTDTGNNLCHLSGVSYPFLISSALNFNSYHSVACSGAKLQDITDQSDEYRGQVKDGLSRLARGNGAIQNILDTFQPGYIDQLDFVKTNRPQIITISTIGNDIGFSSILKHCLGPGTCYGSYEDRVELLRQINSKFDNLTSMFMQLKAAAPISTQIYVIAYPQLAFSGGDCALNVHLNAQEIDFSRLLITYLNSMVKNAAQNTGVQYIDTEDALNGHRLCETTSSLVAVNGLTAGNDAPIGSFGFGPLGQESFHPNALGQQLLAQAILGKTGHMTLAQPIADSSLMAPSETNQPLLSAPTTGRTVNLTSYDDALTDDIAIPTSPLVGNVIGWQFALRPLSNYHVTLNGGQINIGTFTSDASSNLSFQTRLTGLVPSGFNTINISGQNQAGEPIDISKTVFVASSPNDYDGDGLPNNADNCPVIAQTGIDIDQDGIDDACDGVIGDPPAIIVPSPSINQPPVDSDPPVNLPPIPQPPAQDPPTVDAPIDTPPPPLTPDLPVNDVPPTDPPPQVSPPPPPVDLLVEPPDAIPPAPSEPTTPVDEAPAPPLPVQDTTSPEPPNIPPLQDAIPPTQPQDPVDSLRPLQDSVTPPPFAQNTVETPPIPDTQLPEPQTVLSDSSSSPGLDDSLPAPAPVTTTEPLVPDAPSTDPIAVTSTTILNPQTPPISSQTDQIQVASAVLAPPSPPQVLSATDSSPQTFSTQLTRHPTPKANFPIFILLGLSLGSLSLLPFLIKLRSRP